MDIKIPEAQPAFEGGVTPTPEVTQSDLGQLPQIPLAGLSGAVAMEGAEVHPDITAPAGRGTSGVPTLPHQPLTGNEIGGAAAPAVPAETPDPAEHAEAREVVEAAEVAPDEPMHPVVEVMDKLRAEEALGDENTRAEMLRNMDVPAAKEVLNAVNGTVRGLPPEKWGMDGRGYIESDAKLLSSQKDYDPPAPRDRQPLLDKALEAARDLPADHAATLTGLGINATHVYNDGCGRTSRFAYTAMTHGYDGSAGDKQLYSALLSETAGRQVVDLNQARMDLPGEYARQNRQEIADRYGYEGKLPAANWGGYGDGCVDDETPDTIQTHPDIPPVGRRVLHGVITDQDLGRNAILQHVLSSGLDPGEFIRTSSDGQRTSIDMDKLVPRLTSDDIKSIGKAHSALKRGYVEDLIDTFTNPERRDRAQEIVDFYRPQPRR
jgi:hypothetical protein